MKSLHRSGWRAFLVVSFVCYLASIIVGQPTVRTVKAVPLHKNSPIVVLNGQMGETPLNRDNQVSGYQDWLKHLSFTIKNVSNKNIIYFRIDLLIWKKAEMPAAIGLPMEFGNRKPQSIEDFGSQAKRRVLRPGEVVKAMVSDEDFSYWDNELKKYGADVDSVTMDIRLVYFDDGSGWQVGTDLKQDPVTKKWIRADKQNTIRPGSSSMWLASLIPIHALGRCGKNSALFVPDIGPEFFFSK